MQKNTKRTLRLIAAVVTILSIYLFAPWRFALFYLTPLPPTIQAQVEQAAEQNIDGIILYVDRPNAEPMRFARGWHDRNKQIPASADALFKIGSIAKLYHAAAVAKLAASGTLDLDKTLADYLPSLKDEFEYADKITLRMMVQHTSGLPNYTDHPDFSWGKSMAFDASLKLALDMDTTFKPGTDYGYSNTNYLLLKQIMADSIGVASSQYIQQEILDRHGLDNTYFSVKDVDLDRLMSGYHIGYEQDFKELDQGMVATAQDVAMFLRALNEGTLFTDAERDIYANLYEFNHSGWVLGYNSNARYDKASKTAVVQFINTTGEDTVLLTKMINQRVWDILFASYL